MKIYPKVVLEIDFKLSVAFLFVFSRFHRVMKNISLVKCELEETSKW